MTPSIRASRPQDLAFITTLERHPDNRELIGQWNDTEHLAAIDGSERWSHWIIEEDGRPAGFIIARDCRAQGAGLYVKRILVGDKDRGLGQAAVAAFLALARVKFSGATPWLIVRNENVRAQAVYRKLGFLPFHPGAEDAARFDAVAEAPAERAFRMRLSRESDPKAV
jgi:ribosomal protein S18 acetylase RimI-like enzyme